MKISVAFRVDASIDIGTGHVMRCLTLADSLRERGANSIFLCRPHLGNLITLIESKGYEVKNLRILNSQIISPEPLDSYAAWLGEGWSVDAEISSEVLGGKIFDWIVVDHYALDQKWEKVMRKHCRRLMVIDDLANRSHDCDLLLDQNFGRSPSDYDCMVPESSTLLIGPKFSLLRPEFFRNRSKSLQRRVNPEFKRILITMGGVDKVNMTGKVLRAVKQTSLASDTQVTVVLGSGAPHAEQISKEIRSLPWSARLLINVKDMAKVMVENDLVIGAAGGTIWECCSLGLPAIVIPLADNQKSGADALKRNESAIVINNCDHIQEVFRNLSSSRLLKVIERASGLTDGLGARKVLFQMFKHNLNLRKVIAQDEDLLFSWLNDDLTRQNSLNSGLVSLETHRAWLISRLAQEEQSRMFILEEDAKPVGQIRFDKQDSGEWEISYSIEFSSRGRGLGGVIVDYGMSVFDSVNHDVIFSAKVKKSNLASQKIFKSLGFIKSFNDKQFTVYRKIQRS